MTLYDRPIRDPKVFERARTTFELLELAEKIMRQNIRRRHPELSEEEVEERVVDWYRRRPAPFERVGGRIRAPAGRE
jgi:hypothetical protein